MISLLGLDILLTSSYKARCLAQRLPMDNRGHLTDSRDAASTRPVRLPRWLRHPRVYPSGSYRGRQSPPPNAALQRHSEHSVPATLRDRRMCHSILNASQASSSVDSVRPLLANKRLAPLPRFDPFVRMRSESLSSIMDAPHLLLLLSTETADPSSPRLRKCRTTGNMKEGYHHLGDAARHVMRGHQDLRRHQSGGLAFRTAF